MKTTAAGAGRTTIAMDGRALQSFSVPVDGIIGWDGRIGSELD